MILAIERDVEFGSEFAGVEGAAGKKAITDLQSGDFSPAVVDAKDQIFRVWIVFDIYFPDFDAAVFQKRFGAAAIGAPSGAVHDDSGSGVVGHWS